MAITGRFEADFASFYEACRQAQVSLKGFEGSTRDVEKQVNEMVDSFTGRRVVSEATVMADAVGKIGGPARLTQQELRRVGQVADEAIEKMNRWGEAPPRNLLRLAEAARQTRSGFGAAAGQIREVDNVLDLFGIHLGPARKAMDDIAFAAENGAGKLGLVGTAGLALGAAIGGWQIGRAISEFTGLDQKIGDVVLHLQGLPTVAEAAAAATADAIARAQKAHPELKILTGETANLLNKLDAQDKVGANEAASNVEDRVNAVARVAAEIKKVMDEVASIENSGVWTDLTSQINSQVVSLSDLAKQYHVSDEAMNLLARDAARIAQVDLSNSQKLADVRLQLLQADVARDQQKQKADADAQKARLDQISTDYAATEAQHQKDIEMFDAQVAAYHKVQETNRALREQADAARKAAEAIVSTREYDLTTQEGIESFKRANPFASVTAAATPEYFKSHSLADAVRDGLVSFYTSFGGAAALVQQPPPTGQAPAGGGGAAAAGGGPPPLPPLPGAPTGAAGAAGTSAGRPAGVTQIYAPVAVSGVFDPSSAHALGGVVSHAIWQSVAKSRIFRS